MRIITGSARGCRLKTPKGAEVTRPTADRVKESLFNILGNLVLERKVLDIFAGTGNLGLEALSRGAASAVFVDKATAGLIRENLELTRLAPRGTVCSGDVFVELSRQSAAQAWFDLIFCDPPYHRGLWQRALEQIDGSEGLMAETGIMVVEHGADENDYPELSRLQLVHNRRYGHTTQLSFFQWRSYMEAEEDDV